MSNHKSLIKALPFHIQYQHLYKIYVASQGYENTRIKYLWWKMINMNGSGIKEFQVGAINCFKCFQFYTLMNYMQDAFMDVNKIHLRKRRFESRKILKDFNLDVCFFISLLTVSSVINFLHFECQFCKSASLCVFRRVLVSKVNWFVRATFYALFKKFNADYSGFVKFTFPIHIRYFSSSLFWSPNKCMNRMKRDLIHADTFFIK
jgi:hypothetical protein